MKAAGHTTRYILLLWIGIAVVSAVATELGYVALDGASEDTIAFVMTFAAGAIFSMLASTMPPEAAREGGPVVGLVTPQDSLRRSSWTGCRSHTRLWLGVQEEPGHVGGADSGPHGCVADLGGCGLGVDVLVRCNEAGGGVEERVVAQATGRSSCA